MFSSSPRNLGLTGQIDIVVDGIRGCQWWSWEHLAAPRLPTAPRRPAASRGTTGQQPPLTVAVVATASLATGCRGSLVGQESLHDHHFLGSSDFLTFLPEFSRGAAAAARCTYGKGIAEDGL